MRNSIITPIYNNLELCRETIESVLENTSNGYEYILVYNHPLDNRILPYIQEVKAKNEQVIILDKGRNLGCHVAVNAGLEISTGDYKTKLDDDTVIKTPQWDEKLIDTMKYVSKNLGHCSMIAPISNAMHGSMQVPYRVKDTQFNKITGGTLGFSCVVFPKETYELYGPMLTKNWQTGEIDEQSLYGGEELAWATTAVSHGHCFGYDTGVNIYHQGNEWRDPAYVAFKYGGGFLGWFSYDTEELKRNPDMLARVYKYWLTNTDNDWYIHTARKELIKMGYDISGDMG